jgi:hypothetical protein
MVPANVPSSLRYSYNKISMFPRVSMDSHTAQLLLTQNKHNNFIIISINIKVLLLTIFVVLLLFPRTFSLIHASFRNPLSSASIKNTNLFLLLMEHHTIRIYCVAV